MKVVAKSFALFLFCCLALSAWAQLPENIMTESGMPMRPLPVDDVVESSITLNKRVLPYDQPREADIFWKKRVWRIIDVREKMNLAFAYPKRPFLEILIDATKDPENPLRVFGDEEFKQVLDTATLNQVLYRVDTVPITDPTTYEVTIQIIKNDINFDDIERYRVKEMWFFDKESSTLQVRILGIAPVVPVMADNGDKIGERAMFWIYYPEAREVLAREQVFNPYNDASPLTWEDIFEMRYFSSYVYKASNVKDLRLQDEYTGRDMLLEAEKIKQQIFNFENDLWTY